MSSTMFLSPITSCTRTLYRAKCKELVSKKLKLIAACLLCSRLLSDVVTQLSDSLLPSLGCGPAVFRLLHSVASTQRRNVCWAIWKCTCWVMRVTAHQWFILFTIIHPFACSTWSRRTLCMCTWCRSGFFHRRDWRPHTVFFFLLSIFIHS